MHTRHTLQLTEDWDIALDSVGNIAVAQGENSTAQNVANECRLFTKDAYFAQDEGIPHFMLNLGLQVPDSAFRAYLRKSAVKVADVAEILAITIEHIDRESRVITGTITFTTKEGEHGQVSF